jgi:predicted nucleic acid-binding protein
VKSPVYVETTIISYLTSRESTELLLAAHQQATRDWWNNFRGDYDVYVSEAVIVEARGGDPEAAERRLEVLALLPEIEISNDSRDLAKELMDKIPLPAKAELDALHIAVAVTNGMDYLLTWNCRHIANATIRHKIEEVCRTAGYEPPTICTPLELMYGKVE